MTYEQFTNQLKDCIKEIIMNAREIAEIEKMLEDEKYTEAKEEEQKCEKYNLVPNYKTGKTEIKK